MHGQREPAQESALVKVLHQIMHADTGIGRAKERPRRRGGIGGCRRRLSEDRRPHQHGRRMLARLLHRERSRYHGAGAVPAAQHAGQQARAVMHVQAGDGLVAFQRPQIIDDEIACLCATCRPCVGEK